MYAYIALVVLTLSWLEVWNASHIKDTVYWSVSVAIGSLFRISQKADDKRFIRNALVDNFKIIVILEFTVNVYTFSLPIEVFLVPIIVTISAVLAYAEYKKEHEPTAKFLGGLMIAFGIALVSFTIHMIAEDPSSFFHAGTLTGFALPIALSILLLPFIFVLVVYVRYEDAYVRIKLMYDEPQFRRRIMRMALCRIHVRTALLTSWLRHIQSSRPRDIGAIDASIKHAKKAALLEKSPPIVSPTQGWSPYLACKYLQASGGIAEDYRPDPSRQARWFSCSSYIRIEGGPVSDYIIYCVEEDEHVARTLKLVVSISDARKSHNARKRFIETASELIKNALYENMPFALRAAILAERPKRLSIGATLAEFSLESWQVPYNCELRLTLSRESRI